VETFEQLVSNLCNAKWIKTPGQALAAGFGAQSSRNVIGIDASNASSSVLYPLRLFANNVDFSGHLVPGLFIEILDTSTLGCAASRAAVRPVTAGLAIEVPLSYHHRSSPDTGGLQRAASGKQRAAVICARRPATGGRGFMGDTGCGRGRRQRGLRAGRHGAAI
jgi:hypothetical protein